MARKAHILIVNSKIVLGIADVAHMASAQKTNKNWESLDSTNKCEKSITIVLRGVAKVEWLLWWVTAKRAEVMRPRSDLETENERQITARHPPAAKIPHCPVLNYVKH
jgi:hypothetical protein